MAKSTRFAKIEVAWLINRLHVSVSDEEVRDLILSRSKSWPQADREAAVEYALEVHHANQALYRTVR